MTRSLITSLILLLSVYSNDGFSQSSEQPLFSRGASLDQGTPLYQERFVSLCKVWGFLKYHHPAVTGGRIDWDEELIRYINEIASVDTKEEISRVYLEWIQSLGNSKTTSRNAEPRNSFDKNFDTTWFHDSALFTKELSEKLSFTYKNRSRRKNHYATKRFFSITFKNEKAYPGMSFPNSSYRLLTLFRYWNMINYYFPSKYLIGEDWTSVLERMIPLFASASNEIDYHSAILQLVSSINDSHAYYVNQFTVQMRGKRLLPCLIKLIDGKAVITNILNDSLGRLDDLQVGDAISKFDGIPTMEIIEANWKYISASNYPTKLKNATWLLSYGPDSVEIEFERNGELKSKVIHRYNDYYLFHRGLVQARKREPDSYKSITDKIGYINVKSLTRKQANKAFAKFKGTEGIIIDLRDYPTAEGYYRVSKKIHTSRVPFVKWLYPIQGSPGKFHFVKSMLGLNKTGRRGKNRYNGQVVLLINEYTQSEGEMACMMLASEPKVKTVGGQTAGADGSVIRVVLPGNFKTVFSSIGVYFPDGREAQRVGIIPDFQVKPTVEGIREGRDELLEKGIEVINHLNQKK